MGTNYYQRTDICDHCNRFKEKHIGKSSMGWQFSFRGYNGMEDQPTIRSFEDWKKQLQSDGEIFDEYGREIPFEEFVAMVEEKKDEPKNTNHYDYCKAEADNHGWDVNMNWKDQEGHSFCRCIHKVKSIRRL